MANMANIDEPEPKPGPAQHRQPSYDTDTQIAQLIFGWIRGDVPRHPKNVLDFKRPITRCGPLSIF